jgi:O-antigen/teichoic acid export membrane protein
MFGSLSNIKINKDLSILFVGRIAQILLSLAALRVITALFTKDEVGNYYLILSICFFFSYILLNPVAMYFSRHLVEWKKNELVLKALVRFCIYLLMCCFIAMVFSIFIFSFLEYQEKFGIVEFIAMIVLTVFVSTLHRNVLTGINVLRSRLIFIIATVATLATGLIIASAIAYFYEAKAVHWFYGLIAAEIITLPFIVKYFLAGYKFDLEGLAVKDKSFEISNVIKFCMPILGTNIFLWGQLYLYRIIVDDKYGSDILGMLGVGLAISTAVFAAIENLIIQYFYPIYLRRIQGASETMRAKAWNDMANEIIPIYFLTGVFMLATGQSLVGILVDEKFHSAYTFTLIAVGLEFFRTMTNLFNYVLQTEYNTRLALMPYISGVIVTLSCLLFIDFSQRLEGVIWVLLSGNALIFFYLFYNVSKIIKLRISVNIKGLLLFSAPFFIFASIPKPEFSFVSDLIIVGVSSMYFLYAVFFLNRNRLGGYR